MSDFEVFGFKPNQFTLHNARPEPLTLKWAARMFTLPAVDKISDKPAYYEDGHPIPGTYVLEDAYTFNGDGQVPEAGSEPNWKAFDAIRNVLGWDPQSKTMKGFAAQSGISFLPNNPSREVVAKVREDGEARYQESLVSWADATVAGYGLAVQRNREAGLMAPPPSVDYQKAVLILKRRQAQIEESLGMADKMGSPDEELEFAAFAEAEAMALAKKAAANKAVDPAELAASLLAQPDIVESLRRKYKFRIRKVGHTGVGTPEDEED